MFSDTLSVFGRNFAAFVAIYVTVGVLVVGVSLLLGILILGSPIVAGAGTFGGFPGFPVAPTDLTDPSEVLAIVTYAVVFGVLNLLITSIVLGAVTYFAVSRYRGATLGLDEAFAKGFDRFGSVLGAVLLRGLIMFLLVLVPLTMIFLGIATRNLGFVLAGAVFTIAGAIAAIYIAIALSLILPAAVMEDRRAVDSLRRSWELTRGHRLSIFGATILLGLVSGGVSLAVTVPIVLSNSLALQIIGGILITAIFGSWDVILASVAYHLIVQERRWVTPWQWSIPAPPTAPPSPPAPPS